MGFVSSSNFTYVWDIFWGVKFLALGEIDFWTVFVLILATVSAKLYVPSKYITTSFKDSKMKGHMSGF